MIIIRRGRILNPTTDALFPAQSGNGVALARTATDNYIRTRIPNVDCTTTNHTPTVVGYDDGTQTNRWVSVAGKSLPQYVGGVGWQFTTNSAIRTSYNIPTSITQYTARVVIPAPYFPTDSSFQPSSVDSYGATVSGTGIRWDNLFWGVGHYQRNYCERVVEEQSACLILVVGTDVQYYFPLWGNVSQVDLTIQRVSATQARVIATSSAGTFQLNITHSLGYTHPYQAEYYFQQVEQGCTAPPPITPYTLQRLQSPSIQYNYELPLDTQQLALPIYFQIKSVEDVFVSPEINAKLELVKSREDTRETVFIPYEYNPSTNLWHEKLPVELDGVVSVNVVVYTNHILERVSVLMGSAVLHYVPAPHQVEWMAVVPVEMEQSGIPSGIIPSGYDVLGTPDYSRVLDDGTIVVLPAQHARVITLHLRERLR